MRLRGLRPRHLQLRIRGKIVSAFAILVLLMVVSGLVSIGRFARLRDRVQEIGQTSLQKRDAVDAMLSAVRDYELAGDDGSCPAAQCRDAGYGDGGVAETGE
jgi:hypothetical protein